MKYLFSTIAIILLILSGCSKPNEKSHQSDQHSKKSITISAAASLKDALEEIKADYEKKHDVDIKFNFGASGVLANQIKSGAPVDLFFSAAQNKVDDLVNAQLIKNNEHTQLLKNTLVIVSDKKISSIQELKNNNIKKIAIGTPETVPAGAYAKEALENSSLWTTVENKIVYTKDVRQALSYVESGNTEAGMVYYTDAKTTALNILDVKDTLHAPITYPLAIIQSDKETKALYKYLQSDKALNVFKSYGFLTK